MSLALGMQHAVRMCQLSSVTFPALEHFATLFQKRSDFCGRINVTQHKMCFRFSVQFFCLKHFSFQEEFSEILLNMYTGLHVKYPSFLSDFNETSILLDSFF